MSPAEGGQIKIKTWVVAPLAMARDDRVFEVYLMALVPAAAPHTFERLDMVQARLLEPQSLATHSPEEVACRLNWKMEDIRIA